MGCDLRLSQTGVSSSIAEGGPEASGNHAGPSTPDTRLGSNPLTPVEPSHTTTTLRQRPSPTVIGLEPARVTF